MTTTLARDFGEIEFFSALLNDHIANYRKFSWAMEEITSHSYFAQFIEVLIIIRVS